MSVDQLDTIRKQLLGLNLYNRCKNPQTHGFATKKLLKARVRELNQTSCNPRCSYRGLRSMCQLKEADIPYKSKDRMKLVPSCYNKASECVGGVPQSQYASRPLQDTLSCSICLEDMDDDSQLSTTACNHTFHTKCLNDWMNSAQSGAQYCPLCKEPLMKFAGPQAQPRSLVLAQTAMQTPNEITDDEIREMFVYVDDPQEQEKVQAVRKLVTEHPDIVPSLKEEAQIIASFVDGEDEDMMTTFNTDMLQIVYQLPQEFIAEMRQSDHPRYLLYILAYLTQQPQQM